MRKEFKNTNKKPVEVSKDQCVDYLIKAGVINSEEEATSAFMEAARERLKRYGGHCENPRSTALYNNLLRLAIFERVLGGELTQHKSVKVESKAGYDKEKYNSLLMQEKIQIKFLFRLLKKREPRINDSGDAKIYGELRHFCAYRDYDMFKVAKDIKAGGLASYFGDPNGSAYLLRNFLKSSEGQAKSETKDQNRWYSRPENGIH